MIELPEAHVLAQQINTTLVGKQIRTALANQTPHGFAWYTGDPAGYNQLLSGKTIQQALAYGSCVEIHVDDLYLLISTPIKYHSADEKRPKKHQLLIEFEDDSAISCSVQMWGGMFCFPADELGGFVDYQMAKVKPSPLTEAFDWDHFNSLIDEDTPKLSAKEFLATKQRIPGLGNGVLQDILWKARIHPKRKMQTLSGQQVEAMFNAVKTVLHQMTLHGGRDTEHDLFGCPGGYLTTLSKNTVGKPCPACGAEIVKEPYMGGSIYFCPGCQKLD
jgi:formamidopyrimidine-DNA glycosylase